MKSLLHTGIVLLSFAGCAKQNVANPASPGVDSVVVSVPMLPPETTASPTTETSAMTNKYEPTSAKELETKIRQFTEASITAKMDHLSTEDRQVVQSLIEASKLLDSIFDRQAYVRGPDLYTQLAAIDNDVARAQTKYFKIMRGPWDRQDHFRPFATSKERPAGAGFYPEDMTAEEFKQWTTAHPSDKTAFENLFTVITRNGQTLEAVPYSKAYASWLKPASDHLLQAAKLTKNKSLAKFLKSRAQAFLTDDYYVSDKDWMDLDSLVEVTIGPYETYEDTLFGYKAAFESFVTIADPKASSDLAKFKKLLPTMEDHLPIAKEMKTKRGAESPIRVVDLIFSSGDARKSVQTIAFNLPNDERVRAEKGAKKVLLRNVIETKFEKIMKPIAQKIITDSQLEHLSADAFFQETLFHELSHSLGPAFTTKDGKKVEVRTALESSFSAIEECKADVMGAYNILFMIDRGEFPKEFRNKLLLSYFAGLFRSTRFGVAEAHGKGAAVQINRFLEAGAAQFDPKTKRFSVQFDKLETAIRDLVKDLCELQFRGDKTAADALLSKYGIVSDSMKVVFENLGDIPIDLKPVYPIAGEK